VDQCPGDVERDADRFLPRQRPSPQPAAEGLASDQLHDEVRARITATEVEQPDDVLVLELGGDLGLPGDRGVGLASRGNGLQRDRALEDQILGPEDSTEATFPEALLELEPARNDLTDLEFFLPRLQLRSTLGGGDLTEKLGERARRRLQ